MAQKSYLNTLLDIMVMCFIRPLCAKLPQMIGYVKCFDSNKAISFKVNDKKLRKKYTKKMRKISSLIGKEFDIEHDGSDKYIKTKIKTYGDKVNTNVQGKKVSKEDASYKFLSLIMLDSVMRLNKEYYSQTFLERCSYEIKKE